MFKFEYNIQLLTEERDTQPARFRKAYNRDIKKLKKFQEQAAALQTKIDALHDQATKYWDNI